MSADFTADAFNKMQKLVDKILPKQGYAYIQIRGARGNPGTTYKIEGPFVNPSPDLGSSHNEFKLTELNAEHFRPPFIKDEFLLLRWFTEGATVHETNPDGRTNSLPNDGIPEFYGGRKRTMRKRNKKRRTNRRKSRVNRK